MAEVLFFIAAIGAIAGAMATVGLRNPFYSVLALVSHLLSLAALFLLLHAEFVAAAQVVVYAGAVMVLYVFVVAYVGGGAEPVSGGGPRLRAISILFAGALLVELCIALLGTGISLLDTEGGELVEGFGAPAGIGEELLTTYLLAFETASLLLLVAAVGAVVLARRRGGLEDPREISVADLMRKPKDEGTLTEGSKGTLTPGAQGTIAEAGGPPGR